MSNQTPQQILNGGYDVLDAKPLILSPGVATQIIAVPGTNKIIINVAVCSDKVYLGKDTADSSRGIPITASYIYYDGADPITYFVGQPIEILTSRPENYYLVSDANADVRILYLGNVTP